jgi:hypothetical protein
VSPATSKDFTVTQEALKSIDEALAEEEHVQLTGFIP